MGLLLSLIKGNQDAEPIAISIDFNAAPLPDEPYQQLHQITSQFPAIISKLKEYKGCAEYIRAAISTPSPKTEQEAMAVLVPSVLLLKELYEFCQQVGIHLRSNRKRTDFNLVEGVLPTAIAFLTSADPIELLPRYQATSTLLSHILDFAIEFDLLKMVNSNLQNDFSYYRRTVSRLKQQQQQVVSDELANKMSLFFANATPVLKSLIDATVAQVQMRKLQQERVCELFGLFAGLGYHSAMSNKEEKHARVVTASILFYDHIQPQESSINVKKSITMMKEMNQEGLVNLVKFGSKHFGDESTPKAIKTLMQ